MPLHKEILTKEQAELLPLIQEFNKDFVLVGGTAIALHIGHRRSIDFDLFSYDDFDNKKIKRKIFGSEFNARIFREALAYFQDINYAEKIDYLKGFAVGDQDIKKSLIRHSLT